MKAIIQTPEAEHLEFENSIKFTRNDDGEFHFPDGESYFRLEIPEELEKATVVHTGSPEPDRGLFHLFCALEKLKREDVETELILTYFPYGMQDQIFKDGEINIAEMLLEKFKNYGVKKIYAINPHFSHRGWTDDYPFEVIDMTEYIMEKAGLEDVVVVGPDLGASERFDISGFKKERKNSFQVEMKGDIEEEVGGKKVLVFDDIIETGGTMSRAYDKLKDMGASEVHAAAIHGVLEKGISRAKNKYDSLWLTNSIPNESFNIMVEPLIEEIVKKHRA